ncbi:MAG: D-alanine--D-alanine ligase [Pseudomonadota bacterium]|jgi:D-alanine-D-alanine ligase|nr:D-alanine--D-alanine ligase [Pseudomonadota bacterium]|tara:strand:- start:671 stop:1576 length:906 start_codon:yes stop_codon:yes gene_type:complete
MMEKYGKVLVLMGGWSNEREISLVSGSYVYDSLIKSGVNTIKLDLTKNNLNEIEKISPDRVFIILHGKGGEDGEIQKYLDSLNIPYTGSNSESSKLCMNKRSTKEILLSNDILTPNYEKISEMEISSIKKRFQYPFIVKPSAEGSSIGVYIVENDGDLERAISANEKISSDFIAEDYIEGLEYTVGILGDSALPVIKLLPPGKFYDFNAKYESDKMQYICPSQLDDSMEYELKKISLNCFKACGCKGWGRVDIIIDDKGNPWVIELNTVPGMTSHSLVPLAAKQRDIDFENLVLKILDSSL